MVYENSVEGVVVTDKNAVIQYVNPATCKMSGYNTEELIGQYPSIWKSTFHDKKFYKSMWKSLLEDGCWEGEIWNRKKNGSIFP
ncbi:MAG: PAS domain-containing protein, partial [Nitrospinota bacterium]|nr:PAS domain-containing protein [Nitrospinota bacterium]